MRPRFRKVLIVRREAYSDTEDFCAITFTFYEVQNGQQNAAPPWGGGWVGEKNQSCWRALFLLAGVGGSRRCVGAEGGGIGVLVLWSAVATVA